MVQIKKHWSVSKLKHKQQFLSIKIILLKTDQNIIGDSIVLSK